MLVNDKGQQTTRTIEQQKQKKTTRTTKSFTKHPVSMLQEEYVKHSLDLHAVEHAYAQHAILPEIIQSHHVLIHGNCTKLLTGRSCRLSPWCQPFQRKIIISNYIPQINLLSISCFFRHSDMHLLLWSSLHSWLYGAILRCGPVPRLVNFA